MNNLENTKITKEEAKNVIYDLAKNLPNEQLVDLVQWLGTRSKSVRDEVMRFFNNTQELNEALSMNCEEAECVECTILYK